MKPILLSVFILFLLASCKTTHNLVSPQVKTLAINDVIIKLNKNNLDKNAANQLPVLYNQLQREQLNKINSFKNDSTLNRWADVFNEYKVLQNAYDTISKYPFTKSLVNITDYQNNIDSLRQHAAQDYYRAASALLIKPERESIKKAHLYFGTADYFVPGYSDAREKMHEAFEKGVINIVINSAQANSVSYIKNISSDSMNYFNNSFLQAVVHDLGDTERVYFPARFYTLSQAKNLGIAPDWIIDVNLLSIKVPKPTTFDFGNMSTQRVDTLLTANSIGQEKVYLNIYEAKRIIKNKWINADGEIELRITDVAKGKIINAGSYAVKYFWSNAHTIPRRDIFLFSNYYWDLVNKTTFESEPGKMEILAGVYSKAYPQIINEITNTVGF